MPKKSFFLALFRKLIKSKIAIVVFAVFLIIVSAVLIFNDGPIEQLVTVKRGSISESVSLTGNTTPVQSVSLTFNSSGVISRAYTDLGKKVYKGQVLAELNTKDLWAGVRSAEASVNIQKATLEGLKAGSRPEDIASSQAALDKAKQDLENMYSGISDTSFDSYAKANDSVRIQLDPFFSNAETTNPQLTYTTADYQSETKAENLRYLATVALNAWQEKLLSISTTNTGLETLVQEELTYLATARDLINSVSKTLDLAPGLTATTLATYKAAVSTALSQVNTAIKNLNTISQNIASQKLTVSQLQAQLNLKIAGSLPTDIAAQEAQVGQALASLDSAIAKLQNAQIVAPISGIVTQFDAKIGQQASQGTILVSVMAESGYEVHAGVSETDVGKVTVGDKVAMTLDAFAGETFNGTVFYIAPAETNTQGVVSYAIKISFDKGEPRLKSGLTANITIETNRKDNVLILPQYAILQNDEGIFVQVLDRETVKDVPVKLGIQDQNGNVEVVSGVKEGDQVLNIGLKSQ
ncbi:MAG: efflux RND transporter periplasmic adaptor subunit [Patescibacteria group bacterium]